MGRLDCIVESGIKYHKLKPLLYSRKINHLINVCVMIISIE